MNYKTTKTFEDSIIRYQAKCRDENGKLLKEDDGNIKWETKEFVLEIRRSISYQKN